MGNVIPFRRPGERNVAAVMGEQAVVIETVLARFGLDGRVTGGDVLGNMERPTHINYKWQMQNIRPPAPDKRYDIQDLTNALVQEFGQGADWQSPNRRDIIVTVPLPGRTE